MSATFDATTTAAYAAANTAAERSALIVAALTGTISVKVFNGSNTEMGSGTMDSPWATASGDTVTVGEVTSFTVGTTATPDSNWYIRFQNAGVTRWVRGSFGLTGSGQNFTWSLDNWTATHTGTIGTATIQTAGNSAPAFTVAPTSASIAATGGTIQFEAVDPDNDAVVYSLTTTRFGITINATTGLVTVTSDAAATSGNIVVQASDGTLTASTTCEVVVSTPETDPLPYYNHSGGPAWLHGFGQIASATGYNNWKSWLGHEPDVVVAWSTPATNWTAFRSGRADVGANFTGALAYLPVTTLIVHAYPMFGKYDNTGAIGTTTGTNLSNANNARPATWSEIANGQYDAHYTAMAAAMRTLISNAGRNPDVNGGNVVIRLGWEMNGDWYDHCIGNSIAEFKAAWAKIVTLIRAVIPTMRFDFSPARPWVGYTAGRNYINPTGLAGFIPDEQYIDYITRSTHDVHTVVPGYGDVAVSTTDAYTFNYKHGASTGSPNTVPDYPTQGYDRQLDLTELATVAQAMGKRYGISEWACQMGTGQTGELLQSQQPQVFIEQVYNWLYTHRNNLCWDAYLSSSNEALHTRTTSVAAIRYKSLWNTGA